MMTEALATIGAITLCLIGIVVIFCIVISIQNRRDFIKKLREDIDNLQIEVNAINHAEDELHKDESFKRHCIMASYRISELNKKMFKEWGIE